VDELCITKCINKTAVLSDGQQCINKTAVLSDGQQWTVTIATIQNRISH